MQTFGFYTPFCSKAFAKTVFSAWKNLINFYLCALWSLLPGRLPCHSTPWIEVPSLRFHGILSLSHQWTSSRLTTILILICAYPVLYLIPNTWHSVWNSIVTANWVVLFDVGYCWMSMTDSAVPIHKLTTGLIILYYTAQRSPLLYRLSCLSLSSLFLCYIG